MTILTAEKKLINFAMTREKICFKHALEWSK